MPYHTCECCGEIAFDGIGGVYCEKANSWYCSSECANDGECEKCEFKEDCDVIL